ncbi:unnamed protein product [Caenorhabditis auriculariae]|uniref:Pinin/SDK/MemA protein domain-containing protein n=1 Tax=Caenorhabditis auriculariae TaxID=2777116 RepID=A0A8S1HRX9_9PELO|nr:unnamed protein product [Caenorhabditis auriculariae]
MTDHLSREIEQAYEKLRDIDGELATLSGRPDRLSSGVGIKRRISNENGDFASFGSARLNDGAGDRFDERRSLGNVTVSRNSVDGGFSRRRVHIEAERDRKAAATAPMPAKRSRVDYLEESATGGEEFDDEADRRHKRTIQSTVVMPTLDSRGREQQIEKMKTSENKEVATRNRRMFSNLLMGTLQNFKKTEKRTANVQAEKQAEVERRLEEKKREEREQRMADKQSLMDKRRQQEAELKALQRKRALMQYADGRITQLKLLSNFIETSSEPRIYFQPVKHTPRSMELQQATQKRIEKKIEERQEQLEKELAAGEDKAKTRKEGENGEEEEEEDDEHYDDDAEPTTAGKDEVIVKNEGEDEGNAEGIEVVVVSDKKTSRNIDVDDEKVKDDDEEEYDDQVELE